MLTNLLFIILASTASAHQKGHGSKIEGLGPNGGKLTGIIAAKDADSTNAKSVGTVEYRVVNDVLSVTLLETDRKTNVKSNAGELTWIVIHKTGKPTVARNSVAAGAPIDFSLNNLKDIRAVELILPSFKAAEVKHVTYMELN